MNTPKALLPRTPALLLILTLAACGGGAAPKPGPGGPAAPPPPASFDTLETAYIGANARLAARSNTAFIPPLIEGMPTTGGATYTGVMFVELDTAGMTTQLYGNADVTANFDVSSMSGSVTDFYGRDRTGSQAAYTGAISLTDGTIGAARPTPSTWTSPAPSRATANPSAFPAPWTAISKAIRFAASSARTRPPQPPSTPTRSPAAYYSPPKSSHKTHAGRAPPSTCARLTRSWRCRAS